MSSWSIRSTAITSRSWSRWRPAWSRCTAPPEAKPLGETTLAPSFVAYLDDQVAYFYDSLPQGTYSFAFRTRAQIPGKFTQPAAYAEMMYDGKVNGNSNGSAVVIQAAP
jgi:hypothetical protein